MAAHLARINNVHMYFDDTLILPACIEVFCSHHACLSLVNLDLTVEGFDTFMGG